MKLWGLIRTDNKITADTVLETPHANKYGVEDWNGPIGELCHALDLSRPVLLGKHLKDLSSFSRVVFKPEDFLEPVSFDKFEVEIFSDEKKK